MFLLPLVKKYSSSRANMSAAAITYTLPAIQLVCHLVFSGNSSSNGTNPGTIQPPSTTSVPPLSAGYIAYPDFGAAYKVYTNSAVSWDVANEKCAQEGAFLATIDSFAKIQVVQNQDPSGTVKHVGFHLIEDTTKWYNIHTGISVAQSSLPWYSGEPNGNGRCAAVRGALNGLGKYSCLTAGNYVCEIAYP